MRKLYFAFIFLLPFTATAQSYELNPFYETLTAKTVAQSAAGLHLKGKVRSVKETLYRKHIEDPKDEDSVIATRYHFTVGGLLDTLSKGDSAKNGLWNSGAYYEVYAYDEKSSRLKKLTVYDGSYYAHILTKTFNAEGFLTQERFYARFREDSEQFNYTAGYTYNKNFTELNIRYKYDEPETHYDRRDDGTWKFTFNNTGLLTGEAHKEQDFGSTTTISYDPKWNLPTGITQIESCATQNSCLSLIKGMAYNAKGQKISESLTDFTIRNSLWNYNYCYQYTYNDHDDLAEKITCNTGKPNLFEAPKPGSLTKSSRSGVVYDYVYDAAGNWVERTEYSLTAGKRTGVVSVVKREIGYY